MYDLNDFIDNLDNEIDKPVIDNLYKLYKTVLTI